MTKPIWEKNTKTAQKEVFQKIEKRPTMWGFSIRVLWQDDRAAGISNNMVREISIQVGFWLFESMTYYPLNK